MPQPNDNARVIFLIVLILWLNAGNDASPGLITAPSLIAQRLARQRAAHGVMNSTRWGDFAPRQADDPDGTAARHLNMTGFRAGDGYAWEDLGRFRDRCVEWSRNANPGRQRQQQQQQEGGEGRDLWDTGEAEPTWQNATGVVSGEWVRRPGSVARQAASYNLTEITPDVSWMGMHAEFGRNITGSEGRVLLRIDDKENTVEYEQVLMEGYPRGGGLVREIAASVTMEDVVGTGTTHEMRLHGVHWPKQGVMLLTTTSEKFAGIFGLPHLTPGPDFFQSSQKVLNQTLDEVLRKKERLRFIDPSNPWSTNPDGPQDNWNPSPHCEYLIYLQVHPLNPTKMYRPPPGLGSNDRLAQIVKGMEDELRFPTGAPIGNVPELQMSAVIWSPDCSYFMESKGPPHYAPADGQHLVGKKEEVFLHSVKTWLLGFAAIIFGQVQLMKNQMRETCTPSTLGRASFITISMMVLADGITFAASSFWTLSASTTFLPSLVVTFAAFLAMTIGGSFLGEIYRTHAPERRNRENRERQQQAATAAASAQPTPPPNPPVTSDSLPRPVTAPPVRDVSATPIIVPSDQDIDAEIAENTAAGAAAVPTPAATATITAAATATTARTDPITPFSTIAGRFVLLGIFLFFLSLAATTWWASVRSAYSNTIAFIYFSLWVPQIIRNVQRNSRRAFSWRFMIGQSILRALPFAYFYLRRDNIIFALPDWRSFAVLAGWLWIQLWVLAFQDALGPRYGLPKGWLPEAWDYHPVLREDNVEAGGLPIGLVSTSLPGSPVLERVRSKSEGEGSGKDKRRPHTRTIDCAICCEILEVPVVRAGEEDPAGGGVAGVLARRQYMVTPCRHIFHSACLEGWLRFRLQCPICREGLPPL
ncbi:uncharacterized protein E0L32_008671 [Thyridium curvatum]|uniref:DSC E3 ubiquitin ligase complex subunit A n=1 Tax=Thyridium curvatum TaxID=1093900 RepID=A0A507AL84_9PEZI|nr:uncharacterized protein E0L32_008671 [Thyridium curvatum]TPX10452.1 hypothetical protein E0L32_008671 [Thyridium curvatum]